MLIIQFISIPFMNVLVGRKIRYDSILFFSKRIPMVR